MCNAHQVRKHVVTLPKTVSPFLYPKNMTHPTVPGIKHTPRFVFQAYSAVLS